MLFKTTNKTQNKTQNKNQKQNIDSFNQFISEANKSIYCDENCQNKKKIEDLKNKYITAENNLSLAEPQYENSKKNYYTFLYGENGYNELIESELGAKVDTIMQEYKNDFDNKTNQINTKINTYNGLLLNYRNVVDLYENYKSSNLKLLKELKDKSNSILTNERKTYYEDNAINILKNFYYFIGLIIYYIIAIFFIIFNIKNYKPPLFKQIIITMIILILPFLMFVLIVKFINILYFIYHYSPKNVYL